MLVGITKDMQKQVTQVLDLKEMVVGEMLRDRSLMVSLFQRCGKAEFKFLVNRYLRRSKHRQVLLQALTQSPVEPLE